MAPSDTAAPAAAEFHQLQLLFTDPIQHDYEVIRPLVLFSETATARSAQTGLDRTTVSDKARRFVQQGMLGLADQRPAHAGRKPQALPDPVARYILYLKQLYPPIHYREIVHILERKFGYHTNHHTIQRFLARYPIPVQLPFPSTLFHDFADAYRARWTVVRLHYEGWHQRSIAGCLQLGERHVRRILAAFQADGFAGLEDQRTRPATHPANQLTLPFLKEVLDVQREYPRAGKFRVQGLLRQQSGQEPPSVATVGRAMARNRQFHQAPGPWIRAQDPQAAATPPKVMRYKPLVPHHYWFVDIRYLVRLNGQWVYSLCLLDGYSRQILAGMVSAHQDTVAVLQLLGAAIAAYGCPTGIVSDNGAVFTAHEYTAVLQELGIWACYIDKGKPWQNLIEAQFKVQLRLADAKFEQAPDLGTMETAHAQFVETFNTTAHWAHRRRKDGARTPAQVLAERRGRPVAPGELERIFKTTQVQRWVNRHGYVSIQRFYLYVERGLARKRVAIWIYEGALRVEYEQTQLARYSATYDRQHQRLQQVSTATLYPTAFRSPQLELWELDAEQWQKVRERAATGRARRQRRAGGQQLALPGWEVAVLLSALLLNDHWATLLRTVLLQGASR